MFKVNDYVVYNSMGVYKIVDIKTEKDISNNDTVYYVLEPVYNDNLTIKVPVNNPKVMMRETITKDDVLSLIASMSEKETVWIENNKERSEKFKAALKTGQCEEVIKVVKTIYLEKQEKSYVGKKLAKSDEDIMRVAERNLYEEFAIALNISPDEVLSYIMERIS